MELDPGKVERGAAPSGSAEREREILRFLREVKESTAASPTALEIYRIVSSRLSDNRSIQAYYKTLDRLAASSRIVVLEESERPYGARVYALAQGVSLSQAFTLDDIREAILYRKPAAILAAVERHNSYLEENRLTILKQTGQELLKETDPPGLVYSMLDESVVAFRATVDEYNVAPDPSLWARLQEEYHHIRRVFLRELSLTHQALSLSPLESFERGDGSVGYSPSNARVEIAARVIGPAAMWISRTDAHAAVGAVSGSDATVRFSQVRFLRASALQDLEGGLVSINSSLAVERLSPESATAKGRKEMVHSLPLTREAIDDPKNRGMIMLRVAYPDLTDSEFEHAKKSATDVVQWRVDAAIFTGAATDIQAGEVIPRPAVHLRDGTVVPQEREHKHYIRNDAYGEFTREALRITRQIIQSIRDSRGRKRVFGGAVKSTQSTFFGSFINWYISRGSAKRLGDPINADWQFSRSATLPDHIYMTHLFASLPPLESGAFYTSFLVTRHFWSTTEYFASTSRVQEAGGWAEFIRAERDSRKRHRAITGEPPDWDEGIEIDDDDFVYLCDNVEYASFYLGTTGGDPAPLVPRYEFILPVEEHAQSRVPFALESQSRLVESIQWSGLMPDRDHNMLTGRSLVRVLPYVVQRAHEMCKTFGAVLERNLHGAVALLLSRSGRARITAGDVELAPVDPEKVIQSLLWGDSGEEGC